MAPMKGFLARATTAWMATSLFLVVLMTVVTVNGTYHPDEAFSALYYCKAVGCNRYHLANWSCASCIEHHPNFTHVNVSHCASDGFLGFTGYNPDDNQIVVAFRGSANLENWIKDLEYKFTDYPPCSGCQVHRGVLLHLAVR